MDYYAKLEEAKKIITELMNDQESQPRSTGTLAYLLLHTRREIDGIEKYVATHGTD